MNPYISIIIPVYNSAKNLRKCLSSILNQSFKDYEVIVIDDGSSDNSYSIIEEYQRSYPCIRAFKHTNHGVSYTRNFGLLQTKGKYICFIDSDDWIESDYLKVFVSAIQKEPDADYVIQGILYDFGKGITKPLFTYPDEYISGCNLIAKAIPKYRLLHDGCPVSKLFKREIVQERHLTFNERLSMHEDHLFVLDYIAYIKSVYLTSATMYHYNRNDNENSLSHRVHAPTQLFEASNLFLDKFKEIDSLFPYCDEIYRKDLYTHYGLNQRLRAILNLYKCGYTYNQRKRIVVAEKKKNMPMYKKWYVCTSVSRKIYYCIFLHAPFMLFDLFNKIIRIAK